MCVYRCRGEEGKSAAAGGDCCTPLDAQQTVFLPGLSHPFKTRRNPAVAAPAARQLLSSTLAHTRVLYCIRSMYRAAADCACVYCIKAVLIVSSPRLAKNDPSPPRLWDSTVYETCIKPLLPRLCRRTSPSVPCKKIRQNGSIKIYVSSKLIDKKQI